MFLIRHQHLPSTYHMPRTVQNAFHILPPLSFIFLRFYLFLERGKGERKKERETSNGCLSHTPTWGPACNPGTCPDRNRTSNLSVCERCPTHCATPAGALIYLWNYFASSQKVLFHFYPVETVRGTKSFTCFFKRQYVGNGKVTYMSPILGVARRKRMMLYLLRKHGRGLWRGQARGWMSTS